MNENPNQSTSVPSKIVGINSGIPDDLRSVARYQKGILGCNLLYLIPVICSFTFPDQLGPILGVCGVVTGLLGTGFVFLLSIKVYGNGVGVLLGILTLIPCIGLLVLLAVNSKATAILKQNGIKVGLLGANISQI